MPVPNLPYHGHKQLFFYFLLPSHRNMDNERQICRNTRQNLPPAGYYLASRWPPAIFSRSILNGVHLLLQTLPHHFFWPLLFFCSAFEQCIFPVPYDNDAKNLLEEYHPW